MAACYHEGESIECEHSEVIAKVIIPKVAINHEKIGRCMKYSCERDGIATIERELSPKVAIIKNTSLLETGDFIESRAFFILVKGFRPLKPKKVGGVSARHNSQVIYPRSFTYGEILYPFEHVAKALENKIRELAIPEAIKSSSRLF